MQHFQTIWIRNHNTIEANKKAVNFLDIHLNLTNGIYQPYNIPTYVHAKSNHPPPIIRNIPKSIKRRLSSISSSSTTFNSNTAINQQALIKSGCNHKLNFHRPTEVTNKPNRRKKATWFNPPFSENVTNIIGKGFLKIISEEFPPSHQ